MHLDRDAPRLFNHTPSYRVAAIRGRGEVMGRPKPISPIRHLTPAQLSQLAERCDYVGSVEHKAARSWLGLPQPRRGRHGETDHKQNATICPLTSDADRLVATGWVREAIRRGQFRNGYWKGDFPRYLWYFDQDGCYWYGFLMNQGAGDDARGQYKGWKISEEEWRETFC